MDAPIFSKTHGRQGMTLLVIHPRPDEASIAAGAPQIGCAVREQGGVICTGGEEGESLDSDLDSGADKSRLCAIQAHTDCHP
jgi:hypothetical protein